MADISRLVRMHVKNIGCIGNDGLTVDLDDIVCLVGANNAGKTTVLRAYELAVKQLELKPEDFNRNANKNPASVELWVHIPEKAANIDEKWKEASDDLLLVRSKWNGQLMVENLLEQLGILRQKNMPRTVRLLALMLYLIVACLSHFVLAP